MQKFSKAFEPSSFLAYTPFLRDKVALMLHKYHLKRHSDFSQLNRARV